MTAEQKELYQIGVNEWYQSGYEEGANLGNQYGFNDGCYNNYRKDNCVAEIRWDHVR